MTLINSNSGAELKLYKVRKPRHACALSRRNASCSGKCAPPLVRYPILGPSVVAVPHHVQSRRPPLSLRRTEFNPHTSREPRYFRTSALHVVCCHKSE